MISVDSSWTPWFQSLLLTSNPPCCQETCIFKGISVHFLLWSQKPWCLIAIMTQFKFNSVMFFALIWKPSSNKCWTAFNIIFLLLSRFYNIFAWYPLYLLLLPIGTANFMLWLYEFFPKYAPWFPVSMALYHLFILIGVFIHSTLLCQKFYLFFLEKFQWPFF